MPIKVVWPSAIATEAEAWRVLDLSGITTSVRQSRNVVRAAYVFLDGNRITLRHRIPLGKEVRLEIRWPNGRVRGEDIMVINRYHVERSPRDISPTVLHRKG